MGLTVGVGVGEQTPQSLGQVSEVSSGTKQKTPGGHFWQTPSPHVGGQSTLQFAEVSPGSQTALPQTGKHGLPSPVSQSEGQLKHDSPLSQTLLPQVRQSGIGVGVGLPVGVGEPVGVGVGVPVGEAVGEAVGEGVGETCTQTPLDCTHSMKLPVGVSHSSEPRERGVVLQYAPPAS